MTTAALKNTKIKDDVDQKFKIYVTAISAITFLASQRSYAFMFLLLPPFLLAWFFQNIYLAIRNPIARKQRISLMGLWILSLGVVFYSHKYHELTARNNANEVIAMIEKYKVDYGVYPENSEAIGMDRIKLRDRCGTICMYSANNSVPYFLYKDTLFIFDTHLYDFKKKAWEYQYD
jgi:hypothetical protein